MFGSFPEDLLAEFKEQFEKRQAMAVGYPMPSYTDPEWGPSDETPTPPSAKTPRWNRR